VTTLKITQKRSVIGRSGTQRRTMQALGLRRIGHSVVHDDNPSIRGMVDSVHHLVEVAVMEEGS
jgi:large subunit ribosomal protein L30